MALLTQCHQVLFSTVQLVVLITRSTVGLVDPEVVDRIQAYPWPGNVRELRNEVQRLLALQRGGITPDLLSLPVYSGDPDAVERVRSLNRSV